MAQTAATRFKDSARQSHPHAQSHPAHLAVLGKLFGMSPAPPEKCRVLELGCKDGSNIIPMAFTLPGSSFLGIESAAAPASKAHDTISDLGLKNIAIRQQDTDEFSTDGGTFDYIIAHGLYSWVPATTQKRIMEICQEHLSSNGIAYISYNAYPGWHFRSAVRDMARYHTQDEQDLAAASRKARELMQFLAQAIPAENNPYGAVLQQEEKELRKRPDSYLAYDLLEENNTPFYFHQFIDRAAAHGLQYLAEAAFGTMVTSNFPPQIAEALHRLGGTITRTEQYMDFLRNRSFRQTLLCRKERPLDRNVTAKKILPFQIALTTPLTTPVTNIQSAEPETLRNKGDSWLTVASPLVKAGFQHLMEIWPQSTSFAELLQTARSSLLSQSLQTEEVETDILANHILAAYMNNMIALRAQKAPLVTTISDKPKVSALARLLADSQELVTNQLHETVAVDMAVRHLMVLLDGRLDRASLLEHMVSAATGKGSDKQRDEANLRATMETTLNRGLAHLAKNALLVE